MSVNITMIVPIKNTIASVKETSTVTGKGIDLLMAAPGNSHLKSAKTNKSSGDIPVAPIDRSAASRISALYKQIQNLQQKLVELEDSDGDIKELEKLKQLVMSQIKMLQVEIERIQKEEMERQQREQIAKAALGADGINRPTAANNVDVYI